jgi:rhamnogalacturonyl hydrolase YesR
MDIHMNALLLGCTVVASACMTLSAFAQQASSAKQTDPLVERAKNAALSFQRKSWEQGALGVAFLEMGDDLLCVQMAEASLIYPSRDGMLIAASGGAPVDPVMFGEPLWRAAEVSKNPELRKAADNMLQWCLKTAPRAADGTIYHTAQTVWSDSFHTTPPFLAYAGQYDEAIKQIEGHRKRLWDPEKKLISHKWDEASQRLQRKAFWGSGNGWAAAGITRVIRALPSERKSDKQRLAGYLKELIDGCLAYQRPDGLFHDIVDDPSTYVETNLAQMLAYSIYESVRGGWLPESYLKPADRMRAAARAKVDAAGFVQGVAGAPTFDKYGISAEGQAFFLMMEAAAGKLGRPAPAL